MKSRFKHWLMGPVLGLVAWLANAGVLPGPVVSTQWLAQNRDQVQVVAVMSNPKLFTQKPELQKDASTGKVVLEEVGGHLAGARLIDMKTMRTDRQINGLTVKYMLPEQSVFEKAIQAAGIDAGKPIVLVPLGVDPADVDDALRVYWQLKVYGEDQMAVLDGGLAAWLLEGREISTAAAEARTGNWKAVADRGARYGASSEDVSKASTDGSATLVDARDLRSFHGLTKRDYVGAYGHVQGARNYSPELMTRPAGGAVKFMSANTYRALMQAQGVRTDAPAISYCNSGHLASGPWFVLSEILGNTQARLYDGSMHQWTLEKRPVAGAVPLD